VRPYNFPLVRRPVYPPRGGRFPLVDAAFSLSASTVGFLSGVGFDFSRTFATGSSWLRPDEEAAARSALAAHVAKTRDAVSLRSLREPERAFLASTQSTVGAWLADASRKSQRLVLPASPSAFRRKLVYDLLEREFPSLEPRVAVDKSTLTLTVMSAEQRTAYAASRAGRDDGHVEKTLAEAVGFRRVIELLAENKVLLVGHNCWHDLIKCVAAFVAPPPAALPAFKAAVRSGLSPHLLDTKRLVAVAGRSAALPVGLRAALAAGAATGLEGAARAVDAAAAATAAATGAAAADGSGVALEATAFARGFGRYVTPPGTEAVAHYHEAGYDAYQTGRLFLNLAAAVTGATGGRLDGRIRELSAPRLGGPSPSVARLAAAADAAAARGGGGAADGAAANDVDGDLLASLVNRVPLPRCGGYEDVDFGDTSGRDEVNGWEDRTDVLHLSNVFPPDGAAAAANGDAPAPAAAAGAADAAAPPRRVGQEDLLAALAGALPPSEERPQIWWLAPPGTLLLVLHATDVAARTDPATVAAVAAAAAPRGWAVQAYGAYLARARAADAAALGEGGGGGGGAAGAPAD